MPTDETGPPKCQKCGDATELLSFIPRFGDRPAYHIFDCSACKALTWIAEAITGQPDDA
jgi:hypothetical protein